MTRLIDKRRNFTHALAHIERHVTMMRRRMGREGRRVADIFVSHTSSVREAALTARRLVRQWPTMLGASVGLFPADLPGT
jgi:hypothetical protein